MTPRLNTDAELDALNEVCLRLNGFDQDLSLEWLDGALCALAAGPSVPALDAAVAGLVGETWGRTFADPQDDAQAMAAMHSRWRVLLSELDPESLYDDPDLLRLAPLVMMPDDDVDDAPWPMGSRWAQGFLSVVADPAWGWTPPPDADLDGYEESLATLRTLAAEDGTIDERETRFDLACGAVQDLRLWWIEHAPTTAPRRVEVLPGRNDPCPCGSGRKFKKCHGAT